MSTRRSLGCLQFLPVVEAGTLSLIASTTENPSFRVNTALLSRCRVFVLQKLTQDDIYRILVRALRLLHEQRTGDRLATTIEKEEEERTGDGAEEAVSTNGGKLDAASNGVKVESESQQSEQTDAAAVEEGESEPSQPADPPAVDPVFAFTGPVDPPLVRFLAAAADGDARVALSSLELALSATRDTNGKISREELKRSLRKAHLQYDRAGGELLLILSDGSTLTNIWRRCSLRHDQRATQGCPRQRRERSALLACANARRRRRSALRCSPVDQDGKPGVFVLVANLLTLRVRRRARISAMRIRRRYLKPSPLTKRRSSLACRSAMCVCCLLCSLLSN